MQFIRCQNKLQGWCLVLQNMDNMALAGHPLGFLLVPMDLKSSKQLTECVEFVLNNNRCCSCCNYFNDLQLHTLISGA